MQQQWSPPDLERLLPSTRELHAACAREAAMASQQGLTPASAPHLAARIEALADRALEQAVEHGVSVDCRKGCHACCYSPVTSTLVEASAIANHLGISRGPSAIDALIPKLHEYVTQMHAQLASGTPSFKLECPLLDKGECSVYEVRPLECRGKASWDRSLCDSWKAEDSTQAEIEGPNGENELMRAAFAGLQQGLGPGGEALPLSVQLLRIFGQQIEAPPSGRPEWLPEIKPYSLKPDSSIVQFERRRETLPILQCLKILEPPTPARLIASLAVGEGYRDQAELEEVEAHFDRTLDVLEATNFGTSVRDAFDAVEVTRLVHLGYLPTPPKARMARVGRLLEEKVARPLAPELLEPMPPRRPGRLRVGFISQHLGDHSAASWALGWLQGLQTNEFETYAIKIGPPENSSPFFFKKSSEHFLILEGDMLDAARHVRSLDLDYLIFTDLGDGGRNLQMAMFRLARIQAAGWGCPFTSGMPQIDEYLSSDANEPADGSSHYTETLVRLPNNGLTYPSPFPVLQGRGKESFGLEAGTLVVIAQNLAKWLPEDDALLHEIASSPQVRLHVFEVGSARAISVFKERMEPVQERIYYRKWAPRSIFQRMAGLYDLSLDAPTFHGGHSSLAFLGAGTPVLSLLGDQMRSRMALGFQGRAGIPDAVVESKQDYVRLATDPEAIDTMRRQLNSLALFDDPEPIEALGTRIRTAGG